MNFRVVGIAVGVCLLLAGSLQQAAATPISPTGTAQAAEQDLAGLIERWKIIRDEARDRWMANQKTFDARPGPTAARVNQDRGLQAAADRMIRDLERLQQTSRTDAGKQAGFQNLQKAWRERLEETRKRFIANKQSDDMSGPMAASINEDAGAIEALEWMLRSLEQAPEKPATAPAASDETAGLWRRTGVRVAQPEIAPNPCYPGKQIALSDGSAIFSQGYADCTGEQRVKGGERAKTTIKWRFSPGADWLEPGKPLRLTISINRDSSAVPYYGGGSAYFYFRTQQAVGGLELKGFLADPALKRTAQRDLELARVPDGVDGDKLTMWLNVAGESGMGDVFYDYEFRRRASADKTAAAAPAPAPTTTATPPAANPEPQAAGPKKDSGARFSSMTGKIEVRHEGEKEWDFAKLDTVLYVGDHIRASEDSSAIIGFADLSTFLMKEETEIIVTALPDRDSMISLVAGNIMRNVKKMLKDGTMEIEMSQAIAGARGTVFSASADSAALNAVASLEGAVEVRAKATGQKIVLKAGERVVVSTKGLSPVEAFDVRSELARWRKTFAGGDFDDIERRVAPPPQEAETPEGFWAVGEGADGVKLGVVVPDYSATEYVGAVFFCVRRGGVHVSVDSPVRLKKGARANVTIAADGVAADYRGKVEDKVTEDGSAVVFDTTWNDPLFEDLARARAISVAVNGRKARLPTRNAQRAFRTFFDKCQK